VCYLITIGIREWEEYSIPLSEDHAECIGDAFYIFRRPGSIGSPFGAPYLLSEGSEVEISRREKNAFLQRMNEFKLSACT